MDIRKVDNGDDITLYLEGKFGLDDSDKFHKIAFLYPEENIQNIVLDFARLETLDSNGIGMLLILKENATKRGVNVQAINVGKNIRPLFEYSELGKLFAVKYKE